MQESSRLFDDIDSAVHRSSEEETTKLIDLLLECDLVKLVQKMWREYLRPELLEQKQHLPAYFHNSLKVIQLFHFYINVCGFCVVFHLVTQNEYSLIDFCQNV